MKSLVIALTLVFTSHAVVAGGVYQEPDAFIAEVFGDNIPKADVLWLNKDLKNTIANILDHTYKGLRVRYWQQDNKSAWILNEIGKDKPITTGIVIKDGKIERIRILIFRESRGWEVRHTFFTDQFVNAKLKDNTQLDQTIDNISGATLSVRAVKKLARIALLLDQTVNQQESPK